MNALSSFKASGLADSARRLVSISLAVALAACGLGDESVGPASKVALSTRSLLGSSTPGARELFGARATQDSADFNGDGKADLLWYDDKSIVAWLMDGASLLGGAELLRHPAYKVIGTGDFNGDGKSDLVWHDATSGETSLWLMDGASYTLGRLILKAPDRVIGTPDLNGDGKSDLLWYSEATGYTTAWVMDGVNSVNRTILGFDAAWRVVAMPDLNGDGKTDLVWHNAATGKSVAWLMGRLQFTASVDLLTHPSFKVIGTPDLNGDGKSDLLWHDPASGQTVAWLMSGLSLTGGGLLLEDPRFKVIGTPDLDGDGKSDLLWYSAAARQTVTWLMDGVGLKSGGTLMTDTDYEVVGTADLNGDGKSDLQWHRAATGQTAAWLMDGIRLTGGGELLSSTKYRLTSTPIVDRFVWPVDSSNASSGHQGPCLGLSYGCYWLADQSEDAEVVWRDAQPFQQEANESVVPGAKRWHLGADYNLGSGATDLGMPVYATAAGTVVAATSNVCGWGNVLMLLHETSVGPVVSVYGHVDWLNGQPPAVGVGTVARGEQVAKVGKGEWTQTATCSSSGSRDPHLHFEIRLSSSTELGRGYTTDQLAAGGAGPQGQTDPNAFIRARLAPVVSARLNDTGITSDQCYAAGSDALVSCTSAAAIALNDKQDGMIGRDVAHNDNSDGRAGFSFHAVARPGGGTYARTECVADSVTGLMWEGKTNDGGPRDGMAVYTYYGNGAATDASGYVGVVNRLALCGHADWRLPTTVELQSIIDYGRGNPAIDLAWFPNTRLISSSPIYWASEGVSRPSSADNAWTVEFERGAQSWGARWGMFGVRLVRGESAVRSRYTFASLPYPGDAASNAVLDSYTNLTWRRCAEGQLWDGTSCAGSPADFYTVMDALAHAGALGGWRLPSIKELASIHDKSQYFPAIDPVAFPNVLVSRNVADSFYYTATPGNSDLGFGPGAHWGVQFNNLDQAVSFYLNSSGNRGKLRLVK